MSRIYSDSVEINQICSEVNSALTTPSVWMHWKSDLVDTEALKDGKFETGTKWIDIRKIRGADVAHGVEVTDYIENESLSLIISAGQAGLGESNGTGRGVAFLEYRLVDYDTTTTVHLDIKLDEPRLFVRLIKSLFSKNLRTQEYLDLCRKDLQGFKKHVEAVSVAVQ